MRFMIASASSLAINWLSGEDKLAGANCWLSSAGVCLIDQQKFDDSAETVVHRMMTRLVLFLCSSQESGYSERFNCSLHFDRYGLQDLQSVCPLQGQI